jgi:two-component system response regulator NreC
MDKQASPPRVLIVDDHHIVRSSLRAMLEQHGCEVVGEASTASEALAMASRARPQVVLMDLEMPGADGISATREVRKALPNAKVLFLSAHDEEKDVIEALTGAGALGYLLKSDAPDELLNGVRVVASGRRFLSPSIAPMLLQHISDPKRSRTGGPALTTREREVLRLVSQGATSKEIAQQLRISPKTAQVHRDNLKQKLNLRTTADLVRFAVRHKIVKLD